MFHVEHAPIQETTPKLRRTLGQAADLCIDGLHTEMGGQIRRSTAGLPTDVDVQAPGCNADTQVGTCTLAGSAAAYIGGRFPRADQNAVVWRPE